MYISKLTPTHETTIWLALQDFELVRVWDSMVYEDDVEDSLAMSLNASGSLDASQTRQALKLVGM